MSVLPDLKTLYEVDDSLWLEETIALLKERKFDALDLENLIEELTDLADERKWRVANFLGSSLLGMLRSEGINRCNPYLKSNLID